MNASASQFRGRLEQRLRDAGLTSALDPGEFELLEQYYQLLSRWNRRINLTSLPLPDLRFDQRAQSRLSRLAS